MMIIVFKEGFIQSRPLSVATITSIVRFNNYFARSIHEMIFRSWWRIFLQYENEDAWLLEFIFYTTYDF